MKQKKCIVIMNFLFLFLSALMYHRCQPLCALGFGFQNSKDQYKFPIVRLETRHDIYEIYTKPNEN